MNFYFINPHYIHENSWKGIIDILDIKEIIDLNLPENYNSFTCFNKVFDTIEFKYYLNDYRPEYLELLQPLERVKSLKKGIRTIFKPLVDKVIKRYELDPEYKEKGKSNILVLCNDSSKCNSVIYYIASYFFNRLYSLAKDGGYLRKYVDFHRIDFINLKAKAYSAQMGFFCSFENRHNFAYHNRAFDLDLFFSLLEEKHNIDYNSFLKENRTNSNFFDEDVLKEGEDLDYFKLDENKIDSDGEKYTIKEAKTLFQSKEKKVITDKIKTESSNGDSIKGNMKVLIEEDLEQLPWMLEPIELRIFNSFSLRLIDIFFDRIKREHSLYSCFEVSLNNICGAIVITVLMDGRMINMYHFRSDLTGCIGTVYIWGGHLQETFDKIREDGYFFSPRLKVEAISYRIKNAPQPVIGTLIAMNTHA